MRESVLSPVISKKGAFSGSFTSRVMASASGFGSSGRTLCRRQPLRFRSPIRSLGRQQRRWVSLPRSMRSISRQRHVSPASSLVQQQNIRGGEDLREISF
jgi:hypothetical protein